MPDPKLIFNDKGFGSDTVARFRYQAEVTLPFCLECALGSDILSVIPEYLEDIAIEYKNRWRFIQVKSRDPERGLWKLTDVLSKNGALRSLFNSYLQTLDTNVSLEILLEGTIERNNPIVNLRHDYNHHDPTLINKVKEALNIEEDQAIDFISRVTLLKSPAPRPHIHDCNVQMIHHQNISLDHNTVSIIYEKLISEIERAMRAESPGPRWPLYITHPSDMKSGVLEKLRNKRLSASRLREIIAPVYSMPRYLLRRIVDSTSNSISPLERKLIIGGANESIIDQARNLRANTQLHWMKIRAGSLKPSSDIREDLQVRLETYMGSHLATHRDDTKPAISIWNELLNQFTTNAAAIDRQQILHADPLLLLGEICELVNLCTVDFGEANED